MGFCEPARQDYIPPPPGAGGASSNGANGGGYAPPPPPPPISGAQGNADGNGGRGGDEGVDPEVEKHEYDPEACKVLLWIGIYFSAVSNPIHFRFRFLFFGLFWIFSWNRFGNRSLKNLQKNRKRINFRFIRFLIFEASIRESIHYFVELTQH